jgi:hypothetical protein
MRRYVFDSANIETGCMLNECRAPSTVLRVTFGL